MQIKSILVLLPLCAVLSCSGASTTKSKTFTIVTSLSASDVTAGTLSQTRAISTVDIKTEVDKATTLFGNVPTGFKVATATLDVDSSTSSISGYEQVLSGTLKLFLITNSGTRVEAGDTENPTGSEKITFKMRAGFSDFEAAIAEFLAGNFSVGLESTADGPSASSFSATVTLVIQFEFKD